MGRHCRCIQTAQAGHHVEQRKGNKRQRGRQYNPRQKRQTQFGVYAMCSNTHAAFETESMMGDSRLLAASDRICSTEISLIVLVRLGNFGQKIKALRRTAVDYTGRNS